MVKFPTSLWDGLMNKMKMHNESGGGRWKCWVYPLHTKKAVATLIDVHFTHENTCEKTYTSGTNFTLKLECSIT